MKTKAPSFVIFLFVAITVYGQNKSNTKPLPQSIYTVSSFQNSFSYSFINKKLRLNNFSFVYADPNALDLNQFSVRLRDIGKKPSMFLLEDYQKYQDGNLLKGFQFKYDPTRWNLQCPNILAVYVE